MALVGLVTASLLLIGILTFAVPHKEPEKKGPATVRVIIDFNGFGPGQNNTSKIWALGSHPLKNLTENWGTNTYVLNVQMQVERKLNDTDLSIITLKHDEQLDWGVQLALDNGTVYEALEKAAIVANFTFKSEWYPNFRSHRITEIAGVRDGTDNRYWQYYVNGVYMGTGADLTALSDGDTVRWEFRSALQ